MDSKGETVISGNRKTSPSRIISRLLCALAVCLYACSVGDVYYSDFKHLEAGWSKDTPLCFELPDSVEEAVSELDICIRHDNYYPYRNIWIIADFVKDRDVVESDTLNIVLADKFGNWYGSGLGKLFQLRTVVRRGFRPGDYDSVNLWHYMRCDTVPGIYDVGLSLSDKK